MKSAGFRPGELLSDRAVVLCFSPQSLDEHPMILIYNACPALEENARLQGSIAEELGVAVSFAGIPDSTGRSYAIGRRKDLTL